MNSMNRLKVSLIICYYFLNNMIGFGGNILISNDLDSLTIFQISLTLKNKNILPNLTIKSILFEENQPVYAFKDQSIINFDSSKKKNKKVWVRLVTHLGGGAIIGALMGYGTVMLGSKTEDPSNKQLAKIVAPATGALGLFIGGSILLIKTDG